MHKQSKLLLTTFFFLLLIKIIFPQTIVQPVLTLVAPGYNDQDDMCIWIHPTNPSLSTIITSDKSADKLFVYDLSGNVIQTISVPGKPGNIDIRYNFLLSGQQIDIVGYNDRDNEEIVIYKVDRDTRLLSLVRRFSTGSNYGFCLYKSPFTGKYYCFISNSSSTISQYELSDNNNDGIIEGTLVRQMNNGSGNTEGMVADDETGILYAANENSGIYKFEVEPNSSNAGTLVAATSVNGLTQDVEGVVIYYAANGEGYLIASSQGSDNFKVYERKEPHTFVKTIVVAGVNNTDGIDVTNLNLGSAFPQGIFLTHDGPGSIKVSKYEDFDLVIDVSYWNPRDNPLPVELAFFTGSLNGNNIDLRWRTETEVNNYGFDIERTKDNSDWLTIGFVEGHGNSNSLKQYNFIDTDIDQSGTYYYRLKQIDNDGTYEYTAVVSVEVGVPNKFYLSQNYPNPFNPETRIDFTLLQKQLVSIRVYNTLGELVGELVDEVKEAGIYSVNFDASELPSGVYIYRLQTSEFAENMKMTFLK